MPEKDPPNAKRPNPLWAFFSSVRLTVVLLALIVLLAVLGTVIPQRDAMMEGAARHAHTGWAAAMDALRLSDIFHSVWLHILLGLLSLNLVICSLNRLPASLRAFRGHGFADPSPPDGRPPDLTLSTEDPTDEALKKLETLLKKTYRIAARRNAAGMDLLYADRGRYSRFGVYVIHLGVLVIIAGALAGSLFGFKAYVNLAEGESSDVVYLKGGKEQRKFDFSVRCDRFSVAFYENGAPKEYRSDLTFIKGNRIAHQGILRVNSPIVFEGFRFYQASYGIAPGGRIDLGFRRGSGKSQNANLGAGDVLDLPDARVRIARIVENMMEMGPAVKLIVETQKGQIAFWVFQEIAEIEKANPGIVRQVPMFNPGLFAPYVFSLDRMDRRYYTGLQVARDPGAPVVAAGAFLLFAGLMVIFFSGHRQIEVRVETAGGRTRIGISGRSSRSPRGVRADMQRILDEYTKANP